MLYCLLQVLANMTRIFQAIKYYQSTQTVCPIRLGDREGGKRPLENNGILNRNWEFPLLQAIDS